MLLMVLLEMETPMDREAPVPPALPTPTPTATPIANPQMELSDKDVIDNAPSISRVELST